MGWRGYDQHFFDGYYQDTEIYHEQTRRMGIELAYKELLSTADRGMYQLAI